MLIQEIHIIQNLYLGSILIWLISLCFALKIQFLLIFHITITPYKEDIEPKIAKEKKEIIKAVKYLASRYGKDRIFIRFDPILKSKEYPITYHIRA